MIDKIADAYGWGAIESMHMDEAVKLAPLIGVRFVDLQRMALIIQHTNKPADVLRTLNQTAEKLRPKKPQKFDLVGFNRLKSLLEGRGLIPVK